jgi:hypothetical protein
MTPSAKDKAEQLINTFKEVIITVNGCGNTNPCIISGNMGDFSAKRCAVRAVDEIIKQWEYVGTYISDFGGKLNPNLQYWNEVKSYL